MNERDEYSTSDHSTQLLQSHARFELKLEVRPYSSDDFELKKVYHLTLTIITIQLKVALVNVVFRDEGRLRYVYLMVSV